MNPTKVLSQQNISSNSDLQSSLVQNFSRTPLLSFSTDQLNSKQELQEDVLSDSKYTMESLCKSFLKKYANTSFIFQPSSLANQFKAKLRRVYDMTNILEGGGIIEKVEKGSYKWKGKFSINLSEPDIIRADWCSLRSISNLLKELFFSIEKGLTCHNLYDILTNKKQNKYNPSTIRRRIYECCKVFTIVGLIQKVGKCFYNGQLTQKDIQYLMKQKNEKQRGKYEWDERTQNENVLMQKSVSCQSSFKQVKKQESIQCQNSQLYLQQKRRQIIKSITSQLKSQEDLERFIQELTAEFKNRKLLYFKDHEPFTNCQKSNENYKIENYGQTIQQQKNSEQVQFSPLTHRNIIVSSQKINLMNFYGNQNNSFYSYPLNSEELFSNFKAVRKVKGN